MADFSDKVKQYGSVSAALAASGYTKNSNGTWSSSSSGSGGSKSSSSSGGSGSSGRSSSKNTTSSSSSGNSYSGTNYHQDAIDAAARGDWNAVNTALNNRQNKIDAQGGNDRGVSNSQILADLQRQYGGSSSGGSSGSSGGSTSNLVKGPGYVTGGYQLGVNGTPILGDNPYWNKNTTASGADMSRRTDLKNGMAVSNGYTVFYDEDGYAVKAVKGAVDYLPNKDWYVQNGTYNGGNLWTDEEMLSADDLKAIKHIRAGIGTTYTGDQANAAANAIRSKYGYTIDKQGNVYDSGVGASVAARRTQYGLDTNVTDAQQKYLQLMFPEQVNQDNGSLLSAYVALKNGNYNPNTVYTGLQSVQKYAGDYASQNVGVNGGVNLGSYGSGYGGSYGGGYGGGYSMDISDASQYLRDMYAQQLQAELAALKSTYEQNLADISANDDLISAAYDRQRNQAAAQNDLQRMQMNEYGLMRGLGSGASGQMALAQSAALQGNLAQIGTQEAQSLSDNALNRQNLTTAYRNAADQAAAEGNAQMASALYDEYVRQQNLLWQQQQAAIEQANWAAKFAYQQQQDALAQQNWQAQFDYQKQQDDLNYQLTLQKLYGANVGSGSTGSTRSTGNRNTIGGVNNGNLTSEQVKVLQNYYGVNADGLWGNASSAAAGGMTADQAWEAFQNGPLKSIEQSVGMNRTDTGKVAAIQKALNEGKITEAQAEAMLRKFGLM